MNLATDSYVAILGPTGIGKTALIVEYAARANVQLPVVSVDSVQVYKGLDIGSAKPSAAEQAQAPHYVIDCAPMGSQFTAADYCQWVQKTLRDLHARHADIDAQNKILFCGGTGFYFQALETGLFELEPIDPSLRKSLAGRKAAEGLETLYQELKARDPARAAKIAPQDTYRVLRALEIILSQGKSLTELQMQHLTTAQSVIDPKNVKKLVLTMDRHVLRTRIRSRLNKMLAQGWIEEVAGLIKNGFGDWPALNAVGYKQIKMYLAGELKKTDLAHEIETATMQLAKRQATWFRRDSGSVFLDVIEDRAKIDEFLGATFLFSHC